jgi:hypothetical protein
MRPWHRFNFPGRLDIDYMPSRGHRRIAVSLLGVAALLWLVILLSYWQESKKVHILQEALQHMPEQPGIARPIKRTEPVAVSVTKNEMQELEQISRQRNVPWSNIFGGLQRASTASIALIEVTPDPNARSLRMVGEAPRASDIWEYMTKLSRQPGFSQIVLKEHEFRLDQPQQPVRFTLDLKW